MFDAHLKKRGCTYKASIVGGTAILLIANVQRSTGDIDSIRKIPQDIKEEIVSFANAQGIRDTWFNDNASRNLNEFFGKGDEYFANEVFKGNALTLYTPSTNVLILSKIYPILDRPEEAKDLDDIETLLDSGAATLEEFKYAQECFKGRIRFEEDALVRKKSWALSKILEEITSLKSTK